MSWTLPGCLWLNWRQWINRFNFCTSSSFSSELDQERLFASELNSRATAGIRCSSSKSVNEKEMKIMFVLYEHDSEEHIKWSLVCLHLGSVDLWSRMSSSVWKRRFRMRNASLACSSSARQLIEVMWSRNVDAQLGYGSADLGSDKVVAQLGMVAAPIWVAIKLFPSLVR